MTDECPVLPEPTAEELKKAEEQYQFDRLCQLTAGCAANGLLSPQQAITRAEKLRELLEKQRPK